MGAKLGDAKGVAMNLMVELDKSKATAAAYQRQQENASQLLTLKTQELGQSEAEVNYLKEALGKATNNVTALQAQQLASDTELRAKQQARKGSSAISCIPCHSAYARYYRTSL